MFAPAAPTPDVDLKVRVDVVPVPPITRGSVIEVVNVGAVPNTLTPVPVSSVRASSKAADAPEAARFEDASVNKALDAVKSGKLTTDDPESITMFPVVVPPNVRVFKAVV